MSFKFIERSKLWFTISSVIVILGMISLATLGLNFGIDFTGGTRIQAEFPEGTTNDQIRTALSNVNATDAQGREANLGNSFVQSLDEGAFSIRTLPLDEEEQDRVVEALETEFPGFTVLSGPDIVGPTVGAELIKNAILALLIAAALLVVYISIRFEFKFAVSAIVTLLFDAFVVLTVFSVTQIELNSPFVAAILTIVGYSINDTIVVFDRIRENLKFPGKDLAAKVDRAISQSVVRTINTSLTTLLVLGSILFLAGDTLRPFALPLFVGVISGTYSSIFLAGSFWHAWKLRERSKKIA
ncbi:protein translocase subunit SecF [Alkalicella caledoniensis]|uniref:Protein-export membrane protein SecF n=1 Tax=Alkalicella caledoniensis TaxID=2731377 RepID=A0A7G9WAN2_ALKCA|nr:protein translocase subunit SecF [Alkalicella caledoniensis]QNO15744.1 protein translocase subunit SecF [Alkalicella caledoniensis]